MKKQLTRNEVDGNYKWDLTKIYENDELWEKDYNKIKEEIKKITSFQGIFTKSAKNLYEFLVFENEIDRKMSKLYYYAHLKHDEDTTNPIYQTLYGKIDDLMSEYATLSSFTSPEMLQINYETVKEYMEEEPRLKEYAFNLENFYRFEKHILNTESEELLSNFSSSLSAPEEIYESLTDSDMKFGHITVNDEEVELTESNYSKYIKSYDRNVRKEAFTRIFETYGGLKNTIAKTFKGNVDVLTSMAKVKHYNNSLEASLYSDNISEQVYHNLIDTVHQKMDVIYKYFNMKKELLNLDELHLYDIYTPLIETKTKEYTFEEAKDIVLKALAPLGEGYIKDLKQAFEQKWIDVYNNVGKRGGAYSSGFYDTYPYVLLNFEGTLNDVSTLAHELGHSMHTYYSCKNNPYQTSSYKIFVAEVASTVNELLLNHYLLETSKDKNEKLTILNNLMELYKSTIYRQVMFAEFERDMHAKKENGEVLTADLLCNEYYELNKKYFGDNVVLDDLIKYEWERIPHFYYDFYVYKYAIGLSSACHIVNNILNHRENALENYLKFLSLGGSDYPANELLVAGVDVTKSDFIISAIDMFEKVIEEFYTLVK